MVSFEADKSESKEFKLGGHILSLTDTSRVYTPFNASDALKQTHQKWIEIIKKKPDFQLAIIGGGIYGCHLAYAFMKAAENVRSFETGKVINAKVTIFEKDAELFSQASGKNSFRIHKGFHYPRSGGTRKMCYYDQCKFIELYPGFYGKMPDGKTPKFPKVFAVANDENTKLDYEALRNLLVGAEYEKGKTMWDETIGELWSEEIRLSEILREEKEEQLIELGLDPELIDGAFVVQAEPTLYADKPRKFFTEQLEKSPYVTLETNTKVLREDVLNENKILVHERQFNYVINCSYNQAIPMHLENHTTFYDVCISVIVAEKQQNGGLPAMSFGIFDGPYPSMEPYDFADEDNLSNELKRFKGQNLFQIFDVKLSSLGRVPENAVKESDAEQRDKDVEKAYEMMAEWEIKKKEGHPEYKEAVERILNKCKRYFPRLEKDFAFAGSRFSLRAKVEDANASRPLIVTADKEVDKKGRFIQVFSSKLSSIFEAEEEVLDIIEAAETKLPRQDTIAAARRLSVVLK